MTELSIRPEEIRDALQKYVEDYQPSAASKEEVGTVAQAGDGIARVSGLPSAMANELLEFEDGTLGIALNLDTREIGVVILGDFDKIEEGQEVRRTGEILSVPVGDAFMGRVIDPLGNPIDGLGDIADAKLASLIPIGTLQHQGHLGTTVAVLGNGAARRRFQQTQPATGRIGHADVVLP